MTESKVTRQRWILIARWLFTGALMALLIWSLDVPTLATELSRFSGIAVCLALVVSVFQVVVSAWRWRFTARRLGLPLTMSFAVREYYLALFLNQCLPGGVLGDVNRAWRHGQGSGQGASALHGVMIERLSGQVVMVLVATLSCVWLITRFPEIGEMIQRGMIQMPGYALFGLVSLLVLLVLFVRLWRRVRQVLASFRKALRLGLFNRSALPVQVASSLVVMGTFLTVFLLLALSSSDGLTATEMATTLALCSLLLLAMVVPITVAGWGVREGAAAILWPLVGLPAEQGVALSVGYGLTVLLSSLPGALFAFTRPSG